MNRHRGILLLTFCVSAMLSGCSSSDELNRVEATGVVTMNGAPLSAGHIAFLPIDGTPGPATGTEISEGKFSLRQAAGPATGRHRIEIRSFQKTGQQVADSTDSERNGTLIDEVRQVVASEFNTGSKLVADLTPETAGRLQFEVSNAPPNGKPAASSKLP